MKCHYEVLNIPRDAEQAEIKSAYRKLALQWHPDKNLDQPDLAKEQFQLVQQAYEVLSDLQERAWYDNHREEILRGAQSNYEDDSLDVFPYFSTSCFKGYDDSTQSFYSVYSEVFSKLASEEIEYLDDPEDYEQIPVFGNSQSTFEVVKAFYAYWQGFSTKKSYAWLSPYNINETRERRVVKLIDKENKKVQQKARRERNEQIRQLVQFVRKRDKRVIAQRKIEEERAQQNKIKAEQMRKEQIRQRNQELSTQVNTMQMDDLESKLREIEKNLADEFGKSESDCSSDLDDSISEENNQNVSGSDTEENVSVKQTMYDRDGVDSLYCVVCNKLFKTISSFKNHEKSKKHKDLLALLLLDMQNDDESKILQEDQKQTNKDICEFDDVAEIENEIVILSDSGEFLGSSPEKTNGFTSSLEKQQDTTKNKKKQKLKPKIIVESPNNSDDEMKVIGQLTHISSDNDSEWETKSKTKQKKKSMNKIKTTNLSNSNTEATESKETQLNQTKNKELKKDKIRTKVKKENIANDVDINHVCVTCKGEFNSKNKLFSHLKSTGHGVALNKKVITKVEKKSKRN
uniref:DnaJ homolog subfamily C member 21 n=1 Tax=Xenopsylla cheopis TaxID=163159 RepID=A0A6M2DI37_XENCH